MLRSRSQWAQADAAGCLGWLVGHIQGTALHELLPLVTRLMVKHTTTDDEVFIREERWREERKSWGRNRSGKSGEGGGGGGGRGRGGASSGGSGENEKDLDLDQARERMDNIRVYTLIFLLKVTLLLELHRALPHCRGLTLQAGRWFIGGRCPTTTVAELLLYLRSVGVTSRNYRYASSAECVGLVGRMKGASLRRVGCDLPALSPLLPT